MGLVQIPSERLGLLVLADGGPDQDVAAVAREELCEVAGEVSMHPQQEYSLDSNTLLLLQLFLL